MKSPRRSLDVFCHCLPDRYCEAALKVVPHPPLMWERARTIPVMGNLEARLELMDRFPGYTQIPSLASPPLEVLAGPEHSPELARIANDCFAEMIESHPDRFPGFVATLPMNDSEAAMEEAHRAVEELGAWGVQAFTNVDGKPLDLPEHLEILEEMGRMGRPVWLHPSRGMNVPDYSTESFSKYEIWWTLGWPYETGVAMTRLVFSGIFDRFPNLRIVTHHAGGMIPMMAGRLGSGMELLGTRTPPDREAAVRTGLRERPLDAMKRFLADTATFGSKSALECGLRFFGIDRMVFATDMPFDPEGGPGYIRETLRAIEEMHLSPEDRERLLWGNAEKLGTALLPRA